MAETWSYSVIPAVSVAGVDALAPSIELLAFKDLAIDWTINDLAVPIRLVEGVDAIVQNMRIRLRFFLGEWFLDQRLGVPWIQRIFVASPDIRDVDQILRRVILSTPGIASVDRFASRFERGERRYYVDEFEAKIVDGSTLRLEETPLLLD